VLCSDLHVRDPDFVSADELLRRCDVIIIGAPHREYRTLQIPAGKVFVDVWNMNGKGCVI
jgi:UDP-N-acetyl-D-mannosaminuronic acid dehydrogenase